MPCVGKAGWDVMRKDEDAATNLAASSAAAAMPAGTGFRFHARNLACTTPGRTGARHMSRRQRRGSAQAPGQGRHRPDADLEETRGIPRDRHDGIPFLRRPCNAKPCAAPEALAPAFPCPSRRSVPDSLHLRSGLACLACDGHALGGNLRAEVGNSLTIANESRHKDSAASVAEPIGGPERKFG